MIIIKNIKEALRKIEAFRQKNIARDEAIARVRTAVKGDVSINIDEEAKTLSEKYELKYEDCLEYVKAERKAKSRRESLAKLKEGLAEMGDNARRMSRERMTIDGEYPAFEKPNLMKSKMFRDE